MSKKDKDKENTSTKQDPLVAIPLPLNYIHLQKQLQKASDTRSKELQAIAKALDFSHLSRSLDEMTKPVERFLTEYGEAIRGINKQTSNIAQALALSTSYTSSINELLKSVKVPDSYYTSLLTGIKLDVSKLEVSSTYTVDHFTTNQVVPRKFSTSDTGRVSRLDFTSTNTLTTKYLDAIIEERVESKLALILEDNDQKKEENKELHKKIVEMDGDIKEMKKLLLSKGVEYLETVGIPTYVMEKSILQLAGVDIAFRSTGNKAYLLKTLFKDSTSVHKKWSVEALIDILGIEGSPNPSEFIRRLVNNIRYAIRNKTPSRISDLIIYDNYTVYINPKYLQKGK